ncbi:MAG: MATE family efflux transporter [Chitinophagales bacterium]|nr:MATE family efflux transporter [Chitinophagales bacterium]
MQISASYKDIWKISYPIMLGSLAQNLIGVTDVIFLGRVGEVALGASGLMSIFYTVMVMMGFGISRGGQILIARRAGEGRYDAIGNIVGNLTVLQLMVASVLFLFMQLAAPYIIGLFISSQAVYQASLEYLYYRSFGIFFSFLGFVLMALYTGIGRTSVIAYTTIFLFVVNAVLNYLLVFGYYGFPQMGVGGSGLASSIAEVLTTLVSLAYMLLDKHTRTYSLLKLPHIEKTIFKRLSQLSLPLVLQYLIGLGGWFLLFVLIENMGERSLAISTVLKQIYTFFSIPAWGYASTANSVVSNLIGQGKQEEVMTAIYRTCFLSFLMTLVCCATLVIFPETFLDIFTKSESVVQGSKTILPILIFVIFSCSMSVVVFNGLMGTGAMRLSLLIEACGMVVYLGYAYLIAKIMLLGLPYIWTAEFVYWTVLLVPSWFYLQSDRWREIRV